ncbi:hypothetical protein AArcSl_1473 [Halalkaliarchaeum desulfuricum]|uniref:Uncharacterized protein n=1 Tax=Halalkaliarchaeum desulfuricum TaxID=2055893 RepID=A0A343TJ30_9EURY|nr:hypothetical protein [Halalkaliarchaeum desulfuricum]AUX09102.1 hypothetical protein AArcSl_1473 [Halalkaliarchaeum desulfuricum]
MFELPIDAWYVWIGVAAASVVVFGLASTFPTAPPPDAGGVAETVDEVAAGSAPASATHAVEADRIAVHPNGLRLGGDGGETTAAFAFGPVTPATEDPLKSVLEGAPASDVFERPEAFQQAAIEAGAGSDAAVGSGSGADADADELDWHATDGTVRVRQVHWGSVRVTLVG